MKLAEMFRHARRSITAGHGDAEHHHEEGAKSAQKESKRLWDVIGRNRHKKAKWQ
ncbi:hypothetical protein [Caballeronia cordobensis]|uniref:Uncharacterized protein n=1 Tax=Caballeronia cordobensis TaxID=1353886 RepID=A0A158GEF3_CABCO|nr:hypothetical protein [Caballeronia cordobensis]AET93568.1 hypothetical protein BYI23_D000580 [Burkholderia sp. YI23]BAO91417.1 uncharacterized protein BRPE67_DCDS02620 [Burkholderia sp. RPE67]SAL30508.1 hypothetical protein AWB70_01890 [Caballeronia cordobensis]